MARKQWGCGVCRFASVLFFLFLITGLADGVSSITKTTTSSLLSPAYSNENVDPPSFTGAQNQTRELLGRFSSIETVSAPLLQILQILQHLGSYAESLDGLVSSQCLVDLKAYQESLSKMESWALQMLDSSGKLKPGLLKGQRVLVGDYDQCRLISQQISSNHTIRGQFCRLGVKINTSGLGLSSEMVQGLQLLLGKLVVHVCVPKACNGTDVIYLFRGIAETLNAELLRETTSCVQRKDPTQDKDFWAAIGVFGFLIFLCILGTFVGEIVDGRHRRLEEEKRMPQQQQDKPKAENGEARNHGNGHVNRAFDSRAPDDEVYTHQKAVAMELTAVLEPGDKVKRSLAATRGLPPAENAPAGSPSGGPGLEEAESPPGDSASRGWGPEDVGTAEHARNSTARNESLCTQLATSFSVLRNGKKIFHCSQGRGDLSCVHGIRVLSITWVILGHCFSMYGDTQGNLMDTTRQMGDWTMMPVISGTLSVDTFFLLSGSLTAYVFLRQVEQAGGLSLKAMVLYFIHRFWRLTPLYMLVLLYDACISYYTFLGPFDTALPASELCKTYWWRNLLYVNNLFGADDLCLPWSWYLSNDMQFYFIAPIVLIPWIFGRKTLGCAISLALVVVHIVCTGVIVYRDNSTLLFRNNSEYFKNVYFAPWCRVGPFAVGLLLGYALNQTGCRYKIQKVVAVLGWTAAWLLGLAVVYLPFHTFKDVYVNNVPAWTNAQNSAYEAVSRPLWSAAVAWVVWACCTGYGGFVNALLSWKAWIPLSRLSYAVYLLHLVVFYAFTKNTTDTLYVNAFTATELFLCVTVVTFLASFVFSLLIEAPTLGIEKALLGGGGQRKR